MNKSDYIQQLIDWSQGGSEPPDSPLLEAFQKLQKGAPDKFIQQMQGLYEFKQAKLMRSNVVSQTEDIEEIKITLVTNTNKKKK